MILQRICLLRRRPATTATTHSATTNSATPSTATPIDEVLDHLALHGWTVNEDGQIRCPVCTARHFCASLDHLWDVWRICECRGAIPAHAENGCGLYRTCAQCGAIDITTLAPPADHRPAPPRRGR